MHGNNNILALYYSLPPIWCQLFFIYIKNANDGAYVVGLTAQKVIKNGAAKYLILILLQIMFAASLSFTNVKKQHPVWHCIILRLTLYAVYASFRFLGKNHYFLKCISVYNLN